MTRITYSTISIYNPSCWQSEPARPSFNSLILTQQEICYIRHLDHTPRQYLSTLWRSHRMPHRALAPRQAKTAHRPVLLSSTASSALPPVNQHLLPWSMTTAFSFASSANGAIAPHIKASWTAFARRITSPPGRLQILQDPGQFVFIERPRIGWRGGLRSLRDNLGA